MADPAEIKLILKAAVTSNPLKMTILDLEKDFKKSEGYSIPFRALGFSDLESYLRSIPDALRIVGRGMHAEVQVIVGEKSAHIVDMISKQRSKKSSAGRARRIPFSPNLNTNQSENYNLPNRNSQPFRKSLSPNFERRHDHRRNFAMNQNAFFPNSYMHQNRLVPIPNVALQNQFFNLLNYPVCLQPNSIQHHNHHASFPDWKNLKNNNCRGGFENPNNFTAVPKSKQNGILGEPALFFPNPSNNQNSNQTSNKPCLSTSLDSSNQIDTRRKSGAIPKTPPEVINDKVNYKIPMCIQNNLEELIREYPAGIWCSDLPKLYREKFGSELKHTTYGFKSLIQVCSSLDYIFHHKLGATGDFKLYHKDCPIPEDDLDEAARSPVLNTVEESESHVAALPKIIQSPMHLSSFMYPAEVVMKGEFIPREKLNAPVGEFVDIRVAEIYDPSKFWFFLDENEHKLNELMDHLQDFYTQHHKEYAIPHIMVQENLYCVSIYMDEYHRAIICNSLPTTPCKVKVFFIDYGTVSIVQTDNLFFLHDKFKTLPEQAIRGRLARIYPPVKRKQWSLESSDRFLQLVYQKPLVAQIDRIDEERSAFELLVADTSGEQDIYINDSLVFEGHAIFTHQEQEETELKPEEIPIVTYLHLFPTFAELEQGLAPGLQELLMVQPMGIPFSYLYPQYFKAPPPPASLTSPTPKSPSLIESPSTSLIVSPSPSLIKSPSLSLIKSPSPSEQTFFNQDFQKLCIGERKVILKQEILGKDTHIISYNNMPYLSVDEVQTKFLGKIVPILTIRKKFAFGYFITLENICFNTSRDLKEKLLSYNLVDQSSMCLDVVLLEYLPDFLEGMSGEKVNIENFQDLLKLYNSSEIWHV